MSITASNALSVFDNALWQAMSLEAERQEEHLELIASENYTSQHVMAAQGSVLTNKYAEGYPEKRYYGGCEYVDMAEKIAIERAKSLFECAYANVQPHSGSQANQAVYLALLNPGDKVLGMSLSEGGHLTHGSKVNFSGKTYQFEHYGVDSKTHLIDYDAVLEKAKSFKPKLIIAGISAYSRIIDWQKFREIADSVGAYLMVDMAHVSGLVAAKLYPSPLPFADVVTTTTHKTLRGPRGGMILANRDEALFKKLNSAVFPGCQGGPLMHVIAAKAVAFKEALCDSFKDYQRQVIKNAALMSETLLSRGYQIVSGGTDTHLLQVSFLGQELTGKEAEAALGLANITVNKNTVPNETRSPFVTSGLRLGTPAVTTRGFKEAEISLVSEWIADVLDNANDSAMIEAVKQKVLDLCQDFPVYK